MRLNKLPENKENFKLHISSVDELIDVFEQVDVSKIKHLIKVEKDEIGYLFYIQGENIGILNLSNTQDEITWIDNINAGFEPPIIKGLGYFMIKYVIEDITQYKKLDKFWISNILPDVRDFYEKVAKKLKREGIIRYYVWFGEGKYKDLLFFL